MQHYEALIDDLLVLIKLRADPESMRGLLKNLYLLGKVDGNLQCLEEMKKREQQLPH